MDIRGEILFPSKWIYQTQVSGEVIQKVSLPAHLWNIGLDGIKSELKIYPHKPPPYKNAGFGNIRGILCNSNDWGSELKGILSSGEFY